MVRKAATRGDNFFRSAKERMLLLALNTALKFVERLLTDPRLIEFLARATDEVVDWARQRLTQARRVSHRLAEFIGQRALERRLDNLAEVVERVFATAPPDVLAAMRTSVEEIRKALDVARVLSFAKRRRMHFAIDDSIDELEMALAQAVMRATPASGGASTA